MAELTTTAPGPARRIGAVLVAPLLSRQVRRFLAVVGAFALWQIFAVRADSMLMPTLDATVERLMRDIESGLIWRHAQATLHRGGLGFIIALVGGVSLGILMARNRIVEAAIEPLLAATYPVPKLALYPIFILWLGLGTASKVALVALECIYPIAYNTYSGARSVNKNQMWAAMNAGAGRVRITFSVILKSSLPSIFAGIRIALPIALVVVVVTELIGESLGLGYLIKSAGTRFQPEGAFAVILVLGFMGFVIDRLTVLATRVFAFWEKGTEL